MKNVVEKAVEFFQPSVAEVEAKAQAARQSLIETQTLVEQCRTARTVADEAGEPAAIQKAESDFITAEQSLARQVRAVEVAEQRLAKAKQAEADSIKAGKRKALEQAVQAHHEAAGRAQRAIESLISSVNDMDTADTAMHLAGVSNNAPIGLVFGNNVTRRRVELALIHTKILTGSAPHDLSSLTEWAASVGKTVLLP